MEPTTAATIGALAGVTAKVVDLVGKALRLSKDAKAKETLGEAQQLVISLRESILGLQDRVLSLQEENSQLRQQVRAAENREQLRQQYERRQVGQSWVMVRKGDESRAYYCPTCLENGREMLIQPHPMPEGNLGSHRCSTCKTDFRLL